MKKEYIKPEIQTLYLEQTIMAGSDSEEHQGVRFRVNELPEDENDDMY